MLCTAFIDKKGLMLVWRPPPGLPECEWTLVNKRQTYTETPAAIGPSGGKSVWATSNNNNNKPDCMPEFLFFTPSPITRRHYHRRGAWKDGSLTKKQPVRGSLLAPTWPQWMWTRDHRHTAINTYSRNRQQWGRLQISISKQQSYNSIKVTALKYAHLSSQQPEEWSRDKCSYAM